MSACGLMSQKGLTLALLLRIDALDFDQEFFRYDSGVVSVHPLNARMKLFSF
jgi:hypothetical protein